MSAKLKQLQQKDKILESEIIELSNKVKSFQRTLNKLHKERNIIKSSIDNLTKDFVVSEHALIRYFERVKGYDLNEISKDILSISNLEATYEALGNGKYSNKDLQCKLIIKDKVVVTIE